MQWRLENTVALSGVGSARGARAWLRTRKRALAALALATVWLLLSEAAGAQIGFEGGDPDIAIRPDGRPLIAYYNDKALRLLDCSDEDCTVALSDRFLTSTLTARHRLAIRNDGRPIIAHVGASGSGAFVYDCDDDACTTGQSRPLDTVLPSLFSIAVRPDGLPIVAYGDRDLSIRRTVIFPCEDVDCATGSPRLPPGQSFQSENAIDLALRPSGLPIFSASRDQGLMVYSCADAACLTGSGTEYDIQSADESALAVRSDGTAIVGYVVSGTELRVISCDDGDCSSASVPTVIATSSTLNMRPEVVIRSAPSPVNDLPLFAYIVDTGRSVRIYDCGDAACATGAETILASSPNIDFLSGLSVALRMDGTPIIAFTDQGIINVARCETPDCATFDRGAVLSAGLLKDGFEGQHGGTFDIDKS